MSNSTRPQTNNHANLAHFLSRIGVGPSDAYPPGDCSPSQIVPSPPTTFLQAAFSVVRCAGREQNMMTMEPLPSDTIFLFIKEKWNLSLKLNSYFSIKLVVKKNWAEYLNSIPHPVPM